MKTSWSDARAELTRALIDAGVSSSLAADVVTAVDGLDGEPDPTAEAIAAGLITLTRAGMSGRDLRALLMREDVLAATDLLERDVTISDLRRLALGGLLTDAVHALDAGTTMADVLRVADTRPALAYRDLAGLTRAGLPPGMLDLIVTTGTGSAADAIERIATAENGWDTVTALLNADAPHPVNAVRGYASLLDPGTPGTAPVPARVRLLAALLASGTIMTAAGMLPAAAAAIDTPWLDTARGLLRDRAAHGIASAVDVQHAVVAARALEHDLPAGAIPASGIGPQPTTDAMSLITDALIAEMPRDSALLDTAALRAYAAAAIGQPWAAVAVRTAAAAHAHARGTALAAAVLTARGIPTTQRTVTRPIAPSVPSAPSSPSSAGIGR